MRKVFLNNFHSLWQANIVVAIFAFCFSLFPIIVEKNFPKAVVYLVVSVVAALVTIGSGVKHKQVTRGKAVHNFHVYFLTTVYYINIMLFGIYLGVWASPGKLAVCFMIFLIGVFFLFVNPPMYNLSCTLIAMAVFVVSAVLVKEPHDWVFDIANVLIAGILSLLFGWQIVMLRLVAAVNTSRLEAERNSFYDQSTIDELTQLRNRRDFMQTLERRLAFYRSPNDWLCLAIMDVDYFKEYNDHYGHPKGDDCLRVIGRILTSFSIYAARIGGEEFALIWYAKEPEQITDTISRMQQIINNYNILHEKSRVAPHLTVSFGIHAVRCGTCFDPYTLYDLADKALYTAKRDGRNRAVVYNGETLGRA